MSDVGDEEFHWRETYYIFFKQSARPMVTAVEHALGELSRRIQLENLVADDEGRFESVMIQSPDDYAALEVDYESGEAVIEQAAQLAKQLRSEADADGLRRLTSADARLDVMHFERVVTTYDEEEAEEMLDPGCLLMVVEALVKLTGGIAIDPASGAILP